MPGGRLLLLLLRNLGACDVVMSRSVKIPSYLMIWDFVPVQVGALELCWLELYLVC